MMPLNKAFRRPPKRYVPPHVIAQRHLEQHMADVERLQRERVEGFRKLLSQGVAACVIICILWLTKEIWP